MGNLLIWQKSNYCFKKSLYWQSGGGRQYQNKVNGTQYLLFIKYNEVVLQRKKDLKCKIIYCDYTQQNKIIKNE